MYNKSVESYERWLLVIFLMTRCCALEVQNYFFRIWYIPVLFSGGRRTGRAFYFSGTLYQSGVAKLVGLAAQPID